MSTVSLTLLHAKYNLIETARIPIAIISASRAFACASDCAMPFPDARREMADRLSMPTAINTRSTISEIVTIKANPSGPGFLVVTSFISLRLFG